MIHQYVDQWWLEHGNGFLRLMTSSKNKSVHHLCERTGYTKLFEVRVYKAEPLEERTDMFTCAASMERDMPPVVAFARSSPVLALTNHVVNFGWRFADPTQKQAFTALFSEASALDHNFFWWHKKKGLLIVWDDFDSEEGSQMGIGVLACELEDLIALLQDVRHLAAEQGKKAVFWLAPVHEPVELALRQAGYSRDWDNTAYIFEKEHPQHSQPEKSSSVHRSEMV